MPSIRRLVYSVLVGLSIATGAVVSTSSPADAHVRLYFGYGPSPYYGYYPPFGFYGGPFYGYGPYGMYRHHRHRHCGWVWVGRPHHRHKVWDCWYR